MPNYYYFDVNGTKKGPYSRQQLDELKTRGIIMPDTRMETGSGHKGVAKQIPGLFADESNPFTATSPETQGPNSPQNTKTGVAGPFGKILATGNGKGNRGIFTGWVVGLLGAAFLVVILCGVVPSMIIEKNTVSILGTRMSFGDDRANYIFGIGIVSASLLILYVAFYNRGVAKTKITVCENGITGTGCGKYYDISFDLHSFQLTYDKITSTDTVDSLYYGSIVIIHAASAQYKCYVAKPSEIQRIIINQQHKRGE